jgi:glucosamine--fructose-6-phosphate aminotransferase (isomerizing)
MKSIDKNKTILHYSDISINNQDHPHHMLKEIEETHNSLNNIIDTYLRNNPFNNITHDILKDISDIAIIGCGTAYHAGLMGARYIENFAKINTRVYVASEFRYMDPIITSRTLCIFVSQSGETADTIAAQELASQKGSLTIAITNVPYSTLANIVDIVLPTCAGREIAVASTKAYTSQITILYMFARFLENIKYNKSTDYISDIKNLSLAIKSFNMQNIIDISKEIQDKENIFFIGRDYDYVTSLEASLKLKEITYINCNAYPS